MADSNLGRMADIEQAPGRDEPTSVRENVGDTITALGSRSVVSSRISVTAVDTVALEPEGEGGRHILVAIDLSDNGWKALIFAFHHIVRSGDVVTVFYVLDPRELPASSKGNREEYRKDTMVFIHKKVQELQEKEIHASSIKFRVQAEYNQDPRPTILNKLTSKYVGGTKEEYTMLVVGTRGMSNIESMVMGSVSVFLLNHSPIPVVVVRSEKPSKKFSGIYDESNQPGDRSSSRDRGRGRDRSVERIRMSSLDRANQMISNLGLHL